MTAASLRVYEPVEAFPKDQRAVLLASVRYRMGGCSVAIAERAAALRAIAALPPRLTDDTDLVDARGGVVVGGDQSAINPERDGEPEAGVVAEAGWFALDPAAADGQPRFSPAQLHWRSLLALEEFRRGIPGPLLPIFIPGGIHESASRDLADLSQRMVHSRPHAMVCPWHIPLGWLCVFAPRDRLLAPARDHPDARQPAAAGPSVASVPAVESTELPDGRSVPPPIPAAAMSLRYRASMADARRALARALGAVRKTPVPWLAATELEGIGRWLEEFHPRSIVELDYGSLRPPSGQTADGRAGGSAGHDASATDTSIDDIAEALDALKSGDTDAASNIVDGLTVRWDVVRAMRNAS